MFSSNNPRVDFYKYQLFKKTQEKLYNPELGDYFENTDIGKDRYLSDSEMINIMLSVEESEYIEISEKVKQYKLKKNKKGEDSPDPHLVSEVLTNSMQYISDEDRNMIINTFFGIKKTGRIWLAFEEKYNSANAFYSLKNRAKAATVDNMRCLINSNNVLKILHRLIKDHVLAKVYDAGLVDTDINIAKKCRRIVDGNITELEFNKIAEYGSITHAARFHDGTSGAGFIIMDMENAC